MAEKSETPQILDELSKSNTAKAGNRTTRKQQTARRRLTIVLLMIVPLMAGVAYLGIQQFRIQSQLQVLADENSQVRQQLSASTQQFSALQQQVTEEREPPVFDDSSVRELEIMVNQRTENLANRISQLQGLIGEAETPDQQWKILEAEYLLSIANQRLLLESDVDSAITLLENADSSLLNSGNNSVFTVRQSIANDLTRLRSVSMPDREGIYLRLENLLAEMQAVDLLNSMRENFENRRAEDSEAVQVGGDTPGIFGSSLEFLGSIFVWRRWDEVPQAMLAPGQGVAIKQNMKLMLEQAELALLARDTALFHGSLTKAKEWFQRYAVTDSSQGQNVIAELDQLLAININPRLEGIERTLALIAQLNNAETQTSR